LNRSPHRVTVVVTSFNREDYIGPSIESVLNSSFQDFQVLVVDDGSSDGSVDVARTYEKLDRRVRVVVNETNLGQFPNRNRAIGLVDSPFLKYHDSDDLMYPHCLATMVELLDAVPEAGLALSAGRYWPGGPCPMLLTPALAYEREYLGGGLFFCSPSGALFRTEALRELGGFPHRGVASDYCFWLKACVATNVVLAPADLSWYRVHPGQELQSENALRDYAAADGDGWTALNAPDCPLAGTRLTTAKRNYLRVLLKKSFRDIRAGRWSIVQLRLSSASVGWRNWLRFSPWSSRDMMAGTPLDGDGRYLVPDWLRVDSSRPAPEKRRRSS